VPLPPRDLMPACMTRLEQCPSDFGRLEVLTH
jgi:hypothetical protein